MPVPSLAQTIFPKKDKTYTTPLRSYPEGEVRTAVMSPKREFEKPKDTDPESNPLITEPAPPRKRGRPRKT